MSEQSSNEFMGCAAMILAFGLTMGIAKHGWPWVSSAKMAKAIERLERDVDALKVEVAAMKGGGK